MRVFRVETIDGRGPGEVGLDRLYWHSCIAAIEAGTEDPAPPGYIAPGKRAEGDGLQHRIQPQHRFGVASVADLLLWFPSKAGREAMARKGAVLSEYEVPAASVALGDIRLFFDPFEAHLTARHSLATLPD